MPSKTRVEASLTTNRKGSRVHKSCGVVSLDTILLEAQKWKAYACLLSFSRRLDAEEFIAFPITLLFRWMASSTLPPLENVFIAIHLVLARRLMVTHFDMDLNPTVPIKDLKEELVAQLGIPAAHQQWFYRNSLMNEEHTLERIGVIHDSIIEVRPLVAQSSSSKSTASPAELPAEAFRKEHSREV